MNPELTFIWDFGGPLRGLPADQAWLILLGAFGLGTLLAWVSYRFAVVRLGLPSRAALVALRATVFAALLLCLANPVRLERTTAEPPPPPDARQTEPIGRLAVVVDRSDSMTTADNRGRTRLDDALATWRRFEPAARPVYAETQFFSFAEDLQPAASLEQAISRTGGTSATHLHESIAALLTRPKEERPDAIVVLSDGVDNSGESDGLLREAALAAGVPVHFIAGINRERPEPFLRVREFSAPSVVLRRSEFLVQASFEAFSREDRSVPFSLWRGDLRIVSGTLALNTGQNLVPWSFRVAAGEPGLMGLSLRLEDGATARVAGRAAVSVIDQRPVNVVLYQGALDWGLRYLTGALRTDPSFQLLTLVSPVVGVTITSGTGPDGVIVGDLTDKAANLRTVDCIVLARVHAGQLSEGQQQAIVDFVRDGGSVLFTHPDAETIAQLNTSRLAQLLPVVFAANGAGPDAAQKSRAARGRPHVALEPFALTEAGRVSPIFAYASAIDAKLKPKFAEYAPVSQIRAGTEVLAVHPTARDARTGQPHILLAQQTFGRGRCAILTTDGLWRWKMSEPSEARVVETFWQQLLLAIGRRAEPEHIRFIDMPAQVAVGEVVTLRVGGVESGKQPTIVIRAPDGRSAEVPTQATGDKSAPWRIRWRPPQPGSWEFVARVEGDFPTYFFTTAVAAPTGELARVPTAVEALRALAATTGGILLTDKPPFAWQTDTRSHRSANLEPIVIETSRLRWNNWTLLGIALVAYALEMVLRRLWKLL